MKIKKVDKKTLHYFDLFPLLKGLEKERPGIQNRIWKWMGDEWDVAFKPYNGRISSINLYFYGIGDEYEIKGTTEEEIEHCKGFAPEAFSGEYEVKAKIELRLDLNLIWSVYQDEIDDPESFKVYVSW